MVVSFLDQALSALADPTRRSLLNQLKDGPASVTTLARPHKMSVQAVQKHLLVLETAGLVVSRKRGRVRHVAMVAAPLEAVVDYLETYRSFWHEKVDQLVDLLEHGEDER